MKRTATTLIFLMQSRRSVAFLSPKLASTEAPLWRQSVSRTRRYMSKTSLSGGTLSQTINSLASSSLASDYAIRINPPVFSSHENELGSGVYTSTWGFHRLQDWQDSTDVADLRALNDCAQSSSSASESDKISCSWEGPYDNQWYIELDSKATELPKELVCVMSRIMVQSAASHIGSLNDHSSLLHVTIPTMNGITFQEFQCSQLLPNEKEQNDLGIRQLFQPLNADYANMELSDMVNQSGEVLGSLPRPFVHSWNILHRGIGMIVSQDASMLDEAKPNVYVHQRTDTKRIFPSLYDMFVGGVSCRGESAELTAAREVAEELGLKGALDYQQGATQFDPLSAELFKCTVCTTYNRCVVSVFTYQYLTDTESISWQEEEVKWGQFVPYEVVEVAAVLSIDRTIQSGTWPGSFFDVDRVAIGEKVEKLKSKYGSHQVWESWDFVPDGLLVWEAWLKWFNNRTT